MFCKCCTRLSSQKPSQCRWELFPSLWPSFASNQSKLCHVSKGCKRSSYGWFSFVVITSHSINLTGCWTSVERRSPLRGNVDPCGGNDWPCPRDLTEKSCARFSFLGPTLILNLLKRVFRGHFGVTCWSCHLRPNSSFEKAGIVEMSWPTLCKVTAATRS